MQIIFTGNPQKDAALLQKAKELHILVPVEQDSEIAAKIRNANLDFSGLREGTENSAYRKSQITVGVIKRQLCETPCEY